MWLNRKVELPTPVMEVGDLMDVLLDELEEHEVEEFCETMLGYWKRSTECDEIYD